MTGILQRPTEQQRGKTDGRVLSEIGAQKLGNG